MVDTGAWLKRLSTIDTQFDMPYVTIPLLKAASIIAGPRLVISCLLLWLSIPEVHCGIDAERKARIVSWHVTSRLATCPPQKQPCFPQCTNNTCNYRGRCRANTDYRLAQPWRARPTPSTTLTVKSYLSFFWGYADIWNQPLSEKTAVYPSY